MDHRHGPRGWTPAFWLGRRRAFLCLTFLGMRSLLLGSTGEWTAIDAGFSNPPAPYRMLQFSAAG